MMLSFSVQSLSKKAQFYYGVSRNDFAYIDSFPLNSYFRTLMKFLVILLVEIVIVSADSIDTSNACLINYLRHKNFDDEVFNGTAITSTLSDPCKRRIKSEKDSVFLIAHQKYETSSEFNKQFDCFMESIRNDEMFIHLLLKKKAIESIKLNWKAKLNPKNWIPGKKQKAKKFVESEINTIEFENLFVCEYENLFGDVFETFFDSQNMSSISENICIRNSFSKNVTTTETTLKCDEVINLSKSIVFENLQHLYSRKKKSTRKCINEALKNEDYYSPAFNVKMFVQSLQQEQKKQKKKIYVDNMMNIFRKVLKLCK